MACFGFMQQHHSLRKIMESSQERLDDLQAQVAEVEQLEAAVELAEQELKDARDGLADRESGPSPLLRQQLEAVVQVAEANVAVTEKALADLLPGVDSLDVALTRVAPAAESQQGVVTYPISIQVEVPADLQLREGLTTVASIVLNEEKNVLLVPQQALYGTYDQPVVQVVTPTGMEERRVSLGNTDGFWVAVSEGLQEGDRVVMESAAVSTTGGGFGQIRTISGGGRGPR